MRFGCSKNRLNETVLLSTHNICYETVLLSTHNICLGCKIKKNTFQLRTFIWRPDTWVLLNYDLMKDAW